MDKRTPDAAESQTHSGNDVNKTVKNNLLQDKWKARMDSDASRRKNEEPTRFGESVPGGETSSDPERQESVLPPPKNPSSSDSDSKFETNSGDSALAPALKPTELINELYSLASSLVQLAHSLEQFEAVLHHRSTSLSAKPSTTSSLSQLVKDRPDLQEILRQYLFKS